MSLYIFDTDMLTLFGRMHPAVLRSVFHRLTDDIRITPITVEEQLAGWFAVLRAARTPTRVEAAYARLVGAVRALGTWDVVPYTVAVADRFTGLLRLRLNVGGNDLRIAAAALESGAVVVTRNLRDFGRVPGLVCEDWSV